MQFCFSHLCKLIHSSLKVGGNGFACGLVICTLLRLFYGNFTSGLQKRTGFQVSVATQLQSKITYPLSREGEIPTIVAFDKPGMARH